MHSVGSRSSKEVDCVEGGSKDEEDGEKDGLRREGRRISSEVCEEKEGGETRARAHPVEDARPRSSFLRRIPPPFPPPLLGSSGSENVAGALVGVGPERSS